MESANAWQLFRGSDGQLLSDVGCDASMGLLAWGIAQQGLVLEGVSSSFGFAAEGPCQLQSLDDALIQFTVVSGMYFLLPGRWTVSGGVGFAITCKNHRGMFMLGGPLERQGRLRYIDGCTDSLIIPPDRRGSPCLNHLSFPAGVAQTLHSHPSMRVGIVARGCGVAVVHSVQNGRLVQINQPLRAGDMFHIASDTLHCFQTEELGMDIVAFHPDSDTGQEDDDHPMINRTLIDGVSAAKRPLDSIR